MFTVIKSNPIFRLLILTALFIFFIPVSFATTIQGSGPCVIDDVGEHFPPEGCVYVIPQEVIMIIDGLPPGTTIEITPVYEGVYCDVTDSVDACLIENGGLLGGQRQLFDSVMVLKLYGTGQLDGFRRVIKMDITSEWQSAPRTSTDPVQAFDTQVQSQQGVIFGDPDFAQLQITAGTGFGFPSFGHTTLTQRNDGKFHVDSFFDLGYQVDFVGAPGGVLDGLSGTTQATSRIEARSIIQPCIIPEDLAGTVALPAVGCDFRNPHYESLHIISGLPPGSTIELKPQITDIVCTGPGGICAQAGGNLGGERETFNATMILQVRGTGVYDGFNRILRLPISAIKDSAPRIPGSPVQSFITDLVDFQGSLIGDPDFASLTLMAGSTNGLSGQGATVLDKTTDGDWSVDSYVDMAYQIDFVGAPGGALDGRSGNTQTIMDLESRNKQAQVIENNNGAGTITLPPSSATYTTYDDPLNIIDGLPPGTTLELIPSIETFICIDPQCGSTGGALGGESEKYNASLNLQITGTSSLRGFQRSLNLPVSIESHSASRIGSDTEQMVETDLFSLQAVLTGDPDFAQLVITAGTDNSLPSPGHTNLKDLGDGTFQVDSFFDVTYQIDFTGAPGSVLDGLSGTTTGTKTLTAVNDPANIAHSITIVLNTLSGHSTDIDFTGDLGLFTLDDDNDPTVGNTRTFSNLDFVEYQFNTVMPPFTELTAFECDDPDVSFTNNPPNFQTTLDLDVDEDILCTFTTQATDIIFTNGFESP